MSYSINAMITPKAAARLLLSWELDLTAQWSNMSASKVFDALLKMSIEDILRIVDCNLFGTVADIKTIPQFGSIENLIRTAEAFFENGVISLDNAQLGFYLKRDVNASLGSNIKFGETHGKAACLVGIVNGEKHRFVPNALTGAFCGYGEDKKAEIVDRLLFRIPIIQIILREAREGIVNGYLPMCNLSESTRFRRGVCVRYILKRLEAYGDQELSTRLDNVIWEQKGE